MKIEADFSALKTVKPHEYAVRFLMGGLVTVPAGAALLLPSMLPEPPSAPSV